MIIRRSRRYTVSMGNYESYSFGADVEMSHHDIGLSDEALEKQNDEEFNDTANRLTAEILNELNNQLHDEIEDAAELTSNQKSYLLKAFAIDKKTIKRRK